MRREHPLWRGFFLAGLLTAALVLTGGPDWLRALRGDRPALALLGMTALGAGLTAVPGLLRRRKSSQPKPRRMQLLTCFLCGMAMVLAGGMAGTGRILPALAEGSVSAFAFVGAAAATAFLTARITQRRRRA